MSLLRRLRARLARELVRRDAEDEPREALKSLFALQDRLDLAINTVAMKYENGVHPRHRLTGLADFFTARVADGQRVLDVGCGLGTLAEAIVRSRTVDVVAIDDDPRAIELARARYQHPRLTFQLKDARRDLPEGRFDVVILSNVLEHLEHRRSFVQTLVARVDPQRLLVRLPLSDRAWTVPLRRELGVRWMSDDTHFAEKDEAGWVRELEDAGLTVVHREVRWGEIWCEAQSPARSGR